MFEGLADAGFDLVHPFDARACADALGLAWLVDPDRAAGFIIGNTRALWPKFVAARAADPALAASSDPLDDYVERTISALPDVRVWFAHRRYGSTFLPFQRIAVATGLGTLSTTQLVIHPTYGPWFALRAVVLARGTPPIVSALPAPACDCAACGDAFAHAQLATGAERWRAWLAVRDACCVGRDYRYSDAQVEYHYTHGFLRQESAAPVEKDSLH